MLTFDPDDSKSFRWFLTERFLSEAFSFATAFSALGKPRFESDRKEWGGPLLLASTPDVIVLQWIAQYRIEDLRRDLFWARELQKTTRYFAEIDLSGVAMQVAPARNGTEKEAPRECLLSTNLFAHTPNFS